VPMSSYVANLRAQVGRALLLLPAVAVLPRDDDGRLLLVRHTHTGQWGSLGGAVDPRESPEDAGRRETLEEVGLDAQLGALLGAFGGTPYEVTYPNGDRVVYVVVAYLARVSGTPVPDGEETTEARWFGPGELEGADLNPAGEGDAGRAGLVGHPLMRRRGARYRHRVAARAVDPPPAEAGPSVAEVRAVLAEVGAPADVVELPPDLGSRGRHHVFVFDEVVVKLDLSSDGRRALREMSALELLTPTDLPVPRLLGSGQWRGARRWVAQSRLAGDPPPDALLLAHAPSPGLAAAMGAVGARLHAGPTPPGFGTWAHGPVSLAEDHRRLAGSVAGMAEDAGLLGDSELRRLLEELDRLREALDSAPAVPVLAHRDVQARNVLVDSTGALAGLLDFETAGGGDPAEDFSRFALDWSGPAFAAFCDGYHRAGGRLDADAPTRVAHHALAWALVIFAYVGKLAPDYVEPARQAWARIEAGERPDLGRVVGPVPG